jgi:hypothetical protein
MCSSVKNLDVKVYSFLHKLLYIVLRKRGDFHEKLNNGHFLKFIAGTIKTENLEERKKRSRILCTKTTVMDRRMSYRCYCMY